MRGNRWKTAEQSWKTEEGGAERKDEKFGGQVFPEKAPLTARTSSALMTSLTTSTH